MPFTSNQACVGLSWLRQKKSSVAKTTSPQLLIITYMASVLLMVCTSTAGVNAPPQPGRVEASVAGTVDIIATGAISRFQPPLLQVQYSCCQLSLNPPGAITRITQFHSENSMSQRPRSKNHASDPKACTQTPVLRENYCTPRGENCNTKQYTQRTHNTDANWEE